jgi:protein phosphatase
MTYTVWPNLYVLHAGDSRCYLIRDGYVEQLTNDHTMARRLVEAGGIHPKDAVNSRWSNVLWNVLGGKSQEEIQAEVRQVKLHPGDRLMLCTDGLHRYVNNDVILKTLNDCESCEEACRRFVRIANDAGGEDNVTVIVAQFADDFSRQGEAPQRLVEVPPTDALLPATDVSLPATDRPSR